jgi:hypothetical protein
MALLGRCYYHHEDTGRVDNQALAARPQNSEGKERRKRWGKEGKRRRKEG